MKNDNENSVDSVPAVSNKLSGVLLKLLAVLLIAGASVGGYFFANSQNSNSETTLNQQVANLQNEITDLRTVQTTADQTSNSQSLTNSNAQTNTKATTPAPAIKTIVVYEPGGLFSEAVKQEIDKKLIKPFTSYNKDPMTTSIHVEAPDAGQKQWSIFAISADGSYNSFFYGVVANSGTQDWWFPECFNGDCGFSADFKLEFPDVVKASGN